MGTRNVAAFINTSQAHSFGASVESALFGSDFGVPPISKPNAALPRIHQWELKIFFQLTKY